MADSLAKQAATTDFTGPEPVLGLSVTSVRNTVHQWSVQKQNKVEQHSELSTSKAASAK